MRHPLIVLLVAACVDSPTGPDDLRCPSLPMRADALSLRIVSFEAGLYDTKAAFPTGPGEVLQNDTAWANAVKRWGTDGGLAPDFDTEIVFVNRWVYDGCEVSVDYAGWRDGERLRMVIDPHEPATQCSAYASTVDLIAVPHGGATDIAWCAPAE